MPVLRCQSCGHCAVQSVPANLDELYQSKDYYHADCNTGLGYQDYNSLPLVNWSVEILGSLMLAEGNQSNIPPRLLDIGCATGYYLDFFKEFGWQTFGTDLSSYAQEVCRSKEHVVVDLNAADEDYNFNVVTAFHVIEHLTEFCDFFQVVNRIIKQGSQFFFVVPNVNFVETKWNGHNSSYEHISYFDHKFISEKFTDKISSFQIVLPLGSLVCGFAGALRQDVLVVLEVLSDIIAKQTIETTHQTSLRNATAIQIAFMACFLARACSSALALELLECHRLELAEHRQWIDFAKAMAFIQNGNAYGAAAVLCQMKVESTESKVVRELCVAELLPTLNRSRQASDICFPPIYVISVCNQKRPLGENFFLSAGIQTYPNIHMIHLLDGLPCDCSIPEYFRDLIQNIDCATPDGRATLSTITSGEVRSFLLACDGRAILNQYCLFALQHCIVENKFQFAVPATEGNLFLPTWLPGRRTINRVLDRCMPPLAVAVMFRSDSMPGLSMDQLAKPEAIVRGVPALVVAKTVDVLATVRLS